jgi:hypothetical protein
MEKEDVRASSTSRLLRTAVQSNVMSLTTDDFREFMTSDPDDDESVPLGDALAELAVDVEVDSVEAVRDVRERL